MASIRICFVCLGNICRSPTAEAVMRAHIEERGLQAAIEVDSAGTGAWHVGERPDPRARAEARRRGLCLEGVARQFQPEDFHRFDLVIAMDAENVDALGKIAPDRSLLSKVHLLRDFDPGSPPGEGVPDPYYDSDGGFAAVFDLVDAACRGLLDHTVGIIGSEAR